MLTSNNFKLIDKCRDIKQSKFQEVYHAVQPTVLLNRFTGLIPLIYWKQANEVALNISDKDWMIFTTYFVVYLILLLYNMKIVVNEEIVLQTTKFFQTLFIFMLLFNMHANIIFAYLKRNIVGDCLKIIGEVDHYLRLVDLETDYPSMRKTTTNRLMIFCGIFIMRTVMFSLIPELLFSQQMALLLILLVKFALIYQFTIFAQLLTERYQIINDAIRSFGKEKVSSQAGHLIIEKMYILCRSHFKLCGVAHKLNGAFGFQILVSIAVMIINFLAQYYFLYVICHKDVNNRPIKVIALAIWFVGDFLELFGLLKACTDASDTANDVAIALHEIQNRVEHLELESHIQIYSLQMLHQKISFSALGFFEIDFSLLYAVVGTVLTFLVIVVQYDQAQESAAKAPLPIAFSNMSFTTSVYEDDYDYDGEEEY